MLIGRQRSQPRVVIAGGGFAGMAAAIGLSSSARVTLIDRQRELEFSPNIHELVSRSKRPADLRLSRVRLLERLPGRRFLQAAVIEISPESRTVETDDGGRHRYDHLVVALGGRHDTFGVEGAEEFGRPFKTIDDCERIGEELDALIRRRRQRTSVVVVGGGFEGVEALGEILRRHRRSPHLRLHLVEGASRLLPGTPACLDDAIRERCARWPVEIHCGRRVARVEADRVTLDDGRQLAAALTLWTGGARPPVLLAKSGLTAGPKEWAAARSTLQSADHPDLWIAGDAAALTPTIPKQAYHALDMGVTCAANIDRVSRGLPPRAFRPSSKPTLISFGDLDTYLVAGDLVLAGMALAPLKEGVYQLVMARLDPPSSRRGALGALDRLGRGVKTSAATALTSLAALGSLPGVRKLS